MLSCLCTYLQSFDKGSVQQIHLIEGCRALHPIHLAHKLSHLRLDISAVGRCQRPILSLDSQLIHPLQHILNLVERSLSRLHTGNSVLRIS